MGFNRFLLDIKTERTMGFLDRLLQAERPDLPRDWKSLERDEQWLARLYSNTVRVAE